MTYQTLLVNLELGRSNTRVLDEAGVFADRFNADVIGIAACQPTMVVSSYGTVCGDVYAQDQREITADLEKAEGEFRDALRGNGTSLEWRCEITLTAPAHDLSVHARRADLVMTGSMPSDTFDLSRAANVGSVVMEAGRPVFIVPANPRPMLFRSAVIGWNDTRECRRAAADALPLLTQMGRVMVIEIAALDDLDAAQSRIEDVVSWLARHGVVADRRVERSNGNDHDQLQVVADDANADVIVAGAYGHSRLREWVIGGVTRDLLLQCRHGVLVSH